MMHRDSPFQSRAYRLLFTAQATSLAGTGVTTVALALLAVELAGRDAGLVLGIALALKMVVYVLGAPVLGTLATRFPRRQWLIGLDLARAGLVLMLPFVTAIWQLYVLVVLINLCAASFTPVFQATVPIVLDDEPRYRRALSYSQVAQSLEQLGSPLLAALLLTVMSFDVLFAINAATFLFSASMILAASIPDDQRTRVQRSLDQAMRGVSAYLRTPRLRAAFAMYFAVAAGSAMIIVNSVVYVVGVLSMPENLLGVALAASGAGTMSGAILAPRLLDRFSHRPVMLAGTALLVTALGIGTTLPDWPLFLLTWFIMGAGLGLTQTPVGSLVRMSCHERDSDAFFAANFSLSHLCWFFAYLGAGWIGTTFGMAAAFSVAAGVAVASLIALFGLFPNPDPLHIRHRHDEIVHRHPGAHDEAHQPDGRATEHRHTAVEHTHYYVIDEHHPRWAREG